MGMGIVVNHNLSAMNANRQMGINQSAMSKALEKLSSGLKINRAADDASGLSISEKMRAQIRGLDQASANAQDGISLIQTADGNLNETEDILQRIRELAVKGATGTLAEEDSEAVQDEVKALLEEVDRIGNTTEFNTKKLLDGSLKNSGGASTTTNQTIGADVASQTAAKLTGAIKAGGVTDSSFVNETINIDGTEITVKWNDLSSEDKSTLKNVGNDVVSQQKALDIITREINNAIDKSGTNVAHVSGYVADGKMTIESGTAGVDSKLTTVSAKGVLNDVGALEAKAGTTTFNGTAMIGSASKDAELRAASGKMTAAEQASATALGKKASAVATAAAKASAGKQVMASAINNSNFDALANWNQINDAATAQKYVKSALSAAGMTDSTLQGTIAAGVTAGLTGAEAAAKVKELMQTNSDKMGSAAVKTKITDAGEKANNDTIDAYVAEKQGLTFGEFDLSIGGQFISEVKLKDTINSSTSMASAAKILEEGINKEIDAYNAKIGASEVGDKGFITKVTVNVKDGAFEINSETGSVKLEDKVGQDIVKNLGLSSAQTSASANGGMTLQIGANRGQTMTFGIEDMRTAALGLSNVDLSTQEGSSQALDKLNSAIKKVSKQRSQLGAAQTRLEHTIKNLDTSSENLSSAESRIRDTDMSKEMMNYTKLNILSQAAQSMLAQANQAPQGVLQLLQ